MKKELNENDLSFCYLREYLQSGAGPLSGKQSLFEFIMNSPDRIVVVNCLDSDWVPELLQKCFESLFKWILNANSNIQIPAVIVLNAEDKLRTTIDQDIPYAIPIFGEDFHIKDWVLSKKYYEILGDVGINELNSTIHSAVKHPANLNKKSSDSLSQIYSYNQHLFHQTISKSWEFTIDLDLSITEQMQKPNLFDLELRDYISYYKLIEKGNFVLLSGGIQEGFINVNRLVYAHSLLKDRIAKQISISLQDTSIDAFVVFSDPAIELAHRIQQHIHSRQMNIEIIAVSNYQSPYQDILPIYSDLKRKRIALISTVTSSGELLTNLSADIRKLNGQIVKIFAIYATSKQAIADLLKLNQSKSGLESHILSLYKLSRVSTKDESYTQMIHSDGVSYFHETSLIPQKPRTISYWDWNKSDLNRSLWNKIEQLEGEKQKVISEHLDDNKLHYFLFFNNKLIIQRFGDEIAKSLVAKIVKKVSLNSYTHANLLVASTQWGAQDLTRKIDEALKEKMSHCVLKKFDVVQKVGAISFEISSDQMKNNLLIIIYDEINTGKTILELLDIIYTRYSETMPAEIVVVVFINRMSDSLEKKIGDKYKNLKIYLIHEHRIYIPSFKDSKTGCPACNELKMLESSKREWENNLKLSFDSNQPLLTLDYIKNRINELKDNSPETQSLLSKTKVYNFRYYPHGTSLHPFVIDFNKFSTIPPEFPQFIKSLTDVEINREPALKSCLVSEIDQRKQTDLCF